MPVDARAPRPTQLVGRRSCRAGGARVGRRALRAMRVVSSSWLNLPLPSMSQSENSLSRGVQCLLGICGEDNQQRAMPPSNGARKEMRFGRGVNSVRFVHLD